MLKPFQIRDLHSYPIEENLYDSSTESVVSEPQHAPLNGNVANPQRRRHGTILLSAPEYDEIASNHPKARLTYMDDDDGEIVTVGSSLELVQRLDDDIDISTLFSLSEPSRDGTSPMHVFDIRRSNSVTELWKNIEKKSTVPRDLPGTQELQPSSSLVWDSNMTASCPDHGKTVSSGTNNEFIKNDGVSDLRSRWAHACSPPNLPSKDTSMNEIPFARSFSGSGSSNTVGSSSSITEEGRRQAEEAGNRLRGWRNISVVNRPCPSPTPQIENPWSAYTNNPFDMPARSTSVLRELQPVRLMSSITAEGRRQAEEAGSRLSAGRNLNIGNGAAPSFIHLYRKNPWAPDKPSNAPEDAPISADSSPGRTAEDRKQAQDTGARLSGCRNLSVGNGAVPPFPNLRQENPISSSKPLGAVEYSSTESRANDTADLRSFKEQEESQPLLAAFEAEMTKILSVSASQPEEAPVSAELPTETTETCSTASDSSHRSKPVDILAQLLQNLAGGVESLVSELKTGVPELEYHLSNAQKAIPEHVSTNFQAVLQILDYHVKNLANVVQDASIATGHAAERIRQAELQTAEQVIDSLGKMAGEFGDMGRTLFTAFEAEFGRKHSGTQTETTNSAAVASSQETSQENAIPPRYESRTGMKHVANNENTSSNATMCLPNVQPVTDTNTWPASGQPSTQAEDPKRETGVIPQGPCVPLSQSRPHSFAGPTVEPPTQSMLRPVWTGFSNWPNRPSLVLHPPLPPPAPVPPMPVPLWHEQHNRHAPPASTVNTNLRHTPAKVALSHSHITVQSQSSSGLPKPVNDCLFIGNVGFNVTEKIIEDVFASKGFLAQVHLPADSMTGEHAGFGYANFRSTHSARAALEALQGTHIDGHSINLEFSDHSPIDNLQAAVPIPDRRARSSVTNADSRSVLMQGPPSSQPLRHRQSWHPSSKKLQSSESRRISFKDGFPSTSSHRIPATSSDNNMPNWFDSLRSRPVRPNGIRDAENQSAIRNDSGALLDQSEENAEFAARYPSLLPSRESKAVFPSAPDRLLTLSPNSEIARFPPVSQLDAHIFASQYRAPRHGHSDPQPDRQRENSMIFEQDRKQASEQPSVRTAFRSTPRGSQQMGEMPSRQARRSRLMTPTTPLARHSSPFNPYVHHVSPAPTQSLRRSATEIHSHRNRAHQNSFATRPLSVTEREVDRVIPGSFPADESIPASNDEASYDRDMRIALKRSIIDNCVDNLMSLGYGDGLDGGRQRLTIYAEAVEGKVSDAVKMIEEERAAYAQQSSAR